MKNLQQRFPAPCDEDIFIIFKIFTAFTIFTARLFKNHYGQHIAVFRRSEIGHAVKIVKSENIQ